MESNAAKNNIYWKNVPAAKIIGRNAFPGEELFSRLPPHAKILDLGCGTGEMAEMLAGRGYDITGLDVNAEAITHNRDRRTHVQYVLGDITAPFPFSDRTYDAIVISFVLVNIMPAAQRESLVAEITRVLKPGGVVWVNEGLVSDDYEKRYELCRPFVDDEHDFFVFKEGTASSSITRHEELEQAMHDGRVARVAHHFTMEELRRLFVQYEVLFEKEAVTSSSHTKSVIAMAVLVFKKR